MRLLTNHISQTGHVITTVLLHSYFVLKVEKYCGVFETLGEKRLASHLLSGLEVLLPLLFPSITLEQVSRSHVRSHDSHLIVYGSHDNHMTVYEIT